jgi:hypothetical protein
VVFELFVEWLHHGIYTVDSTVPATRNSEANRDAQAWVLGHRLQSVGFKNYAMGRLYAQYGTPFASKPLRTDDVHYVFTHTTPDSKLCKFFQDFVVSNFQKAKRTEGTSAMWDGVFQAHPTLRQAFISGLRQHTIQPPTISPEQTYMETEEASPEKTALSAPSGTTIPAKRNADGIVVKKELADASNTYRD